MSQPGSDPNPAPQSAPASASPRIQQIGGFELITKVGQGAMGTVFKARQTSLDRIVALKVLPPQIAKDAQFIERFQREARASAKLNHPNIVQGIDVGKDAATGLWYFAMEFVDGPSLKNVLEQQKLLPERRALELVRDVAKALEAVAANGMVHRDIKPDNILVTQRGETKLADLGLARELTEDASITQSGKAVGTPFYMAPEQVRGQLDQIDIRTDMYALGATLFHLVTGKPPFTGATSALIMSMHLTEAAPKANKFNPEVSDACSRLIDKMLQKKPELRYQTPADLVKQIERVISREATGEARPITAQVVPLESKRRVADTSQKSNAGALYGAAALLAVIVAVFALRGGKEPKAGANNDTQPRAVASAGKATPAAKKPLAKPVNGEGVKKATNTKALPPAVPVQQKEPPVAPPPVPKAEDPAQLFAQAQAWDQANPDAFDEILQRYHKAEQAARSAEQRELADKIDDAISTAQKRQSAAAETAWKAAEESIQAAIAAGDYDAALLACQNVPHTLGSDIREKAAARSTALHQEAEEKVNAAVKRIDEFSTNADPGEGLKVLAELERMKYAPTAGIVAALKTRLNDEFANEDVLKKKRQELLAGKRLEEVLQQFDEAMLDPAKNPREIVAKAKSDPALAPVQDKVLAMEKVVLAVDEVARLVQESLERLKGQKVDLETKSGKLSGKVGRIQDGMLYLEIAFGGGAVGTKAVKLSDLTDEQRRIFSGTVDPSTDPQRVAAAISKMAKGKEDLGAAIALLAQAPDFALTPHYQEWVLRKQADQAKATAEAAAPAAWGEIQLRASVPAFSAADAKVLAEKISAFEHKFGETKFAATIKDKLALTKDKVLKSAMINVIANGSFESGALTPWTARQQDAGDKIQVIAAPDAHDGKMLVEINWTRDIPLEQTVTVETGAAYQLTAWVRLKQGDPDDMRFRVYVSNPALRGAAAEITTSIARDLRPNKWILIQANFVATAPSVRVLYNFRNRNRATAEAQIDDIQLVRQSAPAPSVQTSAAPAAVVPDALKAHGLAFWVSPNADTVGSVREMLSNAGGDNRGAAINTDARGKFIEMRQNFINYPASPEVAAIGASGSVFTWVKADNYQGWMGLVCRGDGRIADFTLFTDEGRLSVSFNYPDLPRRRAGEGRGSFFGKSMLTPGKWIFCGATWDSKTVTLFVNGERDNSYPFAGCPLTRSKVVTIGSDPPGGHQFFNGAIGSVMIFNRALTDAEAKELFANPGIKAR